MTTSAVEPQLSSPPTTASLQPTSVTISGASSTPVALTVSSSSSCRILRSPSHESVTTDLSLFSVSTATVGLLTDLVGTHQHHHHHSGHRRLLSACSSTSNKGTLAVSGGGAGGGSECSCAGSAAQMFRGHSPIPDSRHSRPADIPEVLWFEEENDLIRSCAALCSAVGMQKSFSTSDISQLPATDDNGLRIGMRGAVSDLVLSSLQRSGPFLLETCADRLIDHTSRSCSTWVAVGDVASTSQLPSPHGGHYTASCSGTTAAGGSSAPTATTVPSSTTATATPVGACASTTNAATPMVAANVPLVSTPPPPIMPPLFTAADFIRSVNKKVRQNYIRRRLMTTYRALERLSQSEFNLDRIEVAPSTAVASMSLRTPGSSGEHATVQAVGGGGPHTTTVHNGIVVSTTPSRLTVPGAPLPHGSPSSGSNSAKQVVVSSANAAVLRVVKQRANNNMPLTLRDVERERGKPLSKYERNMMIFNWLHTLDETAVVEGIP